jgi:glycosidase
MVTAHRLGIRVLLDVVPNHLSVESPWFQDAQAHGTASHHWGFFDRDMGGQPTHYFDWAHLPNLDYGNPEVRRMIVEAFAHWVRRELKRIDPDILLLAEASATDPTFFGNGFDVAYDWTDELGRWAWASVFEHPHEIQPLLAAALTNEPTGYAPEAIVLRFINNNDTGVRFVDRHGPGLTRVAAILQFTVPGIPALFAGDEIGASYQPYADLTPIGWEDRHRLRPLYQRLADLKHRVPALNTGQIEVLASDPGGSFAYLRPAPPGGTPVLVVLNFGGPAAVELERTPGLEAARGGRGALTDADRPSTGSTGAEETGDLTGATTTHAGAGGQMDNTGGTGTAPVE